MHRLAICAFFSFLFLTACKDEEQAHGAEQDTQPLDYGNIQLPEFAKGFYIDAHGTYTRLVFPSLENEEADPQEVFVAKDLQNIPQTEAEKIQLPIENMALLSTTHLDMLRLLDGWDVLSGVAYADKVVDSTARQMIAEHNIANLSSGWNLDQEKIIAAAPDIFLSYAYEDAAQSALQTDAFQTVSFSEYLEPHPLGRAEWIKVLGCLLGKETEAEAAFNKIRDSYTALAENIATMKGDTETSVFTGSHFQGQWAAPSGESLAAQLLKDAGVDYVFASHIGSGNVKVDYETLVSMQDSIDWWGVVGHYENEVSKQEIAAGDQRLLDFNCFQNDRLFYCNTATADYFGRGVMEPHLMLSDLAGIFHYEGQETFDYTYFQPIKR